MFVLKIMSCICAAYLANFSVASSSLDIVIGGISAVLLLTDYTKRAQVGLRVVKAWSVVQ